MRKAEFNAEEWAKVVEGPPMAGLRVMAAERGGTLRESISMANVYVEARKHQGDSELVEEIVASRPDVDPRGLNARDPGDLARRSMERLRESVEIVERKAPADEAEAYKRFVRDVAEQVASAHKEGGFLGIGGTPRSDAERAALEEIGSILETRTAG